MKPILMVAGVAALVWLVFRPARDTTSAAYVMNPQNWKTLPGYIAGQGALY